MKRVIAALAATVLCASTLPAFAAETAEVSRTITLDPEEVSTFNDTDGDGLGEFEGWGTSLCWWANRVGYDEKLVAEAAKVFFSDEGLDMNIGRYNVGGGDLVGEVKDVLPNEKALFYDLTTNGYKPTYSGTSMNVWTNTSLANATYNRSDADFGIKSGTRVGNLSVIGWVNSLGAEPGQGDNLHYTVQVSTAGQYTVKLIMTLAGGNWNRNAGIKVNGDKEYLVTTDEINQSIIASANNNDLYLITIPNVELKAGENKIDVGGKKINDSDDSWTLDFVKMAVIKSGEEGVLSEGSEFLHAPHITRSDSMVPGYATDVTKIIITEDKPLSWYEQNFARADEECGYAWNYNWEADKNQMAILKAAAAASGEDFLAEAFSNSPPYFMTYSGCSSGGYDANVDNLRADSFNAFAAYMADVIEHWNKEGVFTFQSVSPMNEPYTNYWSANSNKQEGCHFDQGQSQSKILVALDKELKEKDIDIIISGTDETNVETQIASYRALSQEAKDVITRIDTHTYSDAGRTILKDLAISEGKNLWMSEVDGSYRSGTNAGEMGAALGLGEKIIADLNELKSSAWIFWNAIDMHVDSKTTYSSGADYNSWDNFYSRNSFNRGYWGMTVADHDAKEIFLTQKYYAYGQFSRYIRPGYAIIGSSENTLAAYDPEGKQAIIVAVNTAGEDATWAFDLSGFMTMGNDITAIRTSGSLEEGESWADVSENANIVADTKNKNFTSTMKANSITTFIVKGVSLDLELPFEDVVEDDWFYDAVFYNYVNGLMTGMNDTQFGPYGNLSRAQFALMLYRMEGEPEVSSENIFKDIAGHEWYANAVLWAQVNRIVTGYTNGNFGPADLITREQMALMMYRYANYLEYDTNEKVEVDAFADAEKVSGFAEEAMQWAVGNKIITGKEEGTLLDPQGNTTRAEAAVIIQRFMGKYE